VVSATLVGVVVDESGSDEVTAASVRVAICWLVGKSGMGERNDVQVDLDGSS
jgi:hypothetical protein